MREGYACSLPNEPRTISTLLPGAVDPSHDSAGATLTLNASPLAALPGTPCDESPALLAEAQALELVQQQLRNDDSIMTEPAPPSPATATGTASDWVPPSVQSPPSEPPQPCASAATLDDLLLAVPLEPSPSETVTRQRTAVQRLFYHADLEGLIASGAPRDEYDALAVEVYEWLRSQPGQPTSTSICEQLERIVGRAMGDGDKRSSTTSASAAVSTLADQLHLWVQAEVSERLWPPRCIFSADVNTLNSVHVECPHGFICLTGLVDTSLRPRCFKRGCKLRGMRWYRDHCSSLIAWAWRDYRCNRQLQGCSAGVSNESKATAVTSTRPGVGVLVTEFGLLDSYTLGAVGAIVHQTNCTSTRVAGLAEAITMRWPESTPVRTTAEGRALVAKPGTIETVRTANGLWIIAFNAQFLPSGPSRHMVGGTTLSDTAEQRLQWFAQCLEHFADFLSTHHDVRAVAFPLGIACGYGGGVWLHYSKLISDFAARFPIRPSVFLAARKQDMAAYPHPMEACVLDTSIPGQDNQPPLHGIVESLNTWDASQQSTMLLQADRVSPPASGLTTISNELSYVPGTCYNCGIDASVHAVFCIASGAWLCNTRWPQRTTSCIIEHLQQRSARRVALSVTNPRFPSLVPACEVSGANDIFQLRAFVDDRDALHIVTASALNARGIREQDTTPLVNDGCLVPWLAAPHVFTAQEGQTTGAFLTAEANFNNLR